MKRILAVLMSGVMVLSLASCGSKTVTTNETTDPQTENNTQVENTTDTDQTATGEVSDTIDGTSGRTLIVYFSPANSDTVDAISSATPRVGDASSVEYVAQLISTNVDADLAKIVPETAYPLPYNDTADQAKQERDDGARPAFSLDVNPEDYDVIFVGYPIWWYEMPMILDTFFETYDFSEKTIIPFNTHLGSGDGGTYSDIAELEPNATVSEGLAVNGDNAGKAKDDVKDWLTGLGF